MNAKKCKELRRLAKFSSSIPTATTYEDRAVKKEKVPTGKLKYDSTPEFIIIDKITRHLAHCTRKVYKQLKKEYSCKSH
jgi:hypothetical protein